MEHLHITRGQSKAEVEKLLETINQVIHLSSPDVLSSTVRHELNYVAHEGPNLPDFDNLHKVLAPYVVALQTHKPIDDEYNNYCKPKPEVAGILAYALMYLCKEHNLPTSISVSTGLNPNSLFLELVKSLGALAGIIYTERHWASILQRP